MIDGISFIEKLSFNAFNEGTRLQHCVSLSEKLTGVPVKKIGGDQGYSGNDNRTFCKENKIETSFTQKGRSGKNEIKNATMQPDVLRVERDFTGVVAPDVTENEKIGPETRADDIKCDEFDRKNMAKSAG